MFSFAKQLHPDLANVTRRFETAVRRSRIASTRAARRGTRPLLDPLERREVLSLTAIAPNAGYPFTAIVELQATFPDHKTFVGTGTLVDSFHVLTAGHVLYSSADGGFASQILATPELYGTSQPFGTARMTYERTYTTFINFNKAHPGQTGPGDYDIGLITLDRTIGNSTGWMSFGYDNNNSDFARGTIYNTAGYPAAGGYDGRHMELSSGQIAGLSPDGTDLEYFQSSITTYGGQSGSPVWRYTPSTNSRVVYAVHIAGSGAANSLNFATRITQNIYNDLQTWRAADATPKAQSLATLAPVASAALNSNGAATSATLPNPTLLAPSQRGTPVPTLGVAGWPLLTFGDVPQGPIRHRTRPTAFGRALV